MNIRSEEPPKQVDKPLDDFALPPLPSKEEEASGAAKQADSLSQLEIDLSAERDARKEERFYWICLLFIPFNVFIHKAAEDRFVFSLLFMFQIVLLIGAARRLGVDWAVQSLGWFRDWIADVFKKLK